VTKSILTNAVELDHVDVRPILVGLNGDRLRTVDDVDAGFEVDEAR
jgi:hypothetical protein